MSIYNIDSYYTSTGDLDSYYNTSEYVAVLNVTPQTTDPVTEPVVTEPVVSSTLTAKPIVKCPVSSTGPLVFQAVGNIRTQTSYITYKTVITNNLTQFLTYTRNVITGDYFTTQQSGIYSITATFDSSSAISKNWYNHIDPLNPTGINLISKTSFKGQSTLSWTGPLYENDVISFACNLKDNNDLSLCITCLSKF